MGLIVAFAPLAAGACVLLLRLTLPAWRPFQRRRLAISSHFPQLQARPKDP